MTKDTEAVVKYRQKLKLQEAKGFRDTLHSPIFWLVELPSFIFTLSMGFVWMGLLWVSGIKWK